jgi:PTS system mannose-specific IIA component
MIGLVIVTHGRLAAELLAAMEHVMGPQEAVRTVCVGPEDDLESRRLEVGDCIDDVDRGAGVILLADMFGGTPSNLCVAHMARPNVEVLGGVNLPMLVKLAKIRAKVTLANAVTVAQSAGRKYIAVASEALPHCRERAGQPGLAA